jgi:hypothetical protein
MDYLRAQPSFAGKEDTFQLCWGGTVPGLDRPVFSSLDGAARRSYADRILEHTGRLRGLGVTMVSVPIPLTQSIEEYLDFVRWFDEEVIAAS